MAERRKARSGAGGRASTRSREPVESTAPGEDELLDADELEDTDELEDIDDEMLDGDEPETAGSAMTAAKAVQAALRQIAQLTAKQPEGITEVERTEGGWTIGIELVEDQRIPSSADILATYQTTIDANGEMQSYRRIRRYARGRADTEEA